ncbi:ABC transporter substrate-binding protein [Acidisphaera sp. L21]|uniref:ABC transporter substrate-binding protein n=1 Tax=Acidisphaera sp. L21 TaxID=1641851 RepID=UPI00131CF0CD|nr:ABC transporter substrate-binding protein [Acidisphaera sp. L21]
MYRFSAWLCLGLISLAGVAQAQPTDTLHIGMRDDPDILDPTFSRTYVGTVVMTAICDKLFDFDAKLNIVPVLATGYEWADPKTLLIHVRPNVTFQDGEPLDAAAVVYTLQRDLTMNASMRHSEVGAMDHAEVADPMTVRVVMKQPFSPFIATLTDRSGMMVAPKAAEAAGKDFGLHPVCAGPFRFVERVAQDHVTLERYPGYWDASRIHFNRVTYQVIPDSSIRKANLEAGALDIAEVAPLDVDAVSHNPKLAIVSVPSLGYGALTVNIGNGASAKGPMAEDSRVRLALELSLDRDALNSVVFAGSYVANAQATSPISPLYDPAVPIPKRDVERAKALLKEAGVKTPFRVDLAVYNTPQATQAGEVIQAMAADAGFDVHVNTMEFGAVIAATNRGDYQVTLGGWSGLLDTDSNSWSFLHTGGALNIAHYSNPAVDSLLDQARVASDVPARRAIYSQVWQQVNKDLPLIYLWTTRNIQGVSRRVDGFTLMADGLLRLQDVRFKTATP